MKKLFLTIFLTLIVFALIVGGIIVAVMLTNKGTDKEREKTGTCEWLTENEKYKAVSCEASVNGDGVIFINLKNIDSEEALLTTASAIKCSNANNYFTCVGLRRECQVVNQKGPDFAVKCPIPWGPMEAKIDFDIGFAKVRWEK
ncbi:MAG: hypothetical protein QXD41_02500 [Nitrososphaeria archaeon]